MEFTLSTSETLSLSIFLLVYGCFGVSRAESRAEEREQVERILRTAERAWRQRHQAYPYENYSD